MSTNARIGRTQSAKATILRRGAVENEYPESQSEHTRRAAPVKKKTVSYNLALAISSGEGLGQGSPSSPSMSSRSGPPTTADAIAKFAAREPFTFEP